MTEKRKKWQKAGLTILLSAALFCSGFLGSSQSVLAAEDAGTGTQAGKTGTITVEYPVSGAVFSLYAVAKTDGGYTVGDSEDVVPVNTNSAGAAASLADYISSGAVTLEDALMGTAVTEAYGNPDSEYAYAAVFTDLPEGEYLLIGESAQDDAYSYIPQSVLLQLPVKGDDGNPDWNLIVENKYEKKPIEVTPDSRTGKITVLKTWKNDTEETRPSSITVQLLCNEKLPSDYLDSITDDSRKEEFQQSLDTLKGDDGTNATQVILNADNNWTYSWTKLDENYTWTVMEVKVPDGYTVIKTTEGTSVVLTNTKTTPDTPNKPDTPSKKLPQTGQLWWPIPMMIAGGLFLILIGLLVRPRRNQ